MKKSLFIILMVCLALVGLVSCKNEIEPAQEELVYVSFENGTSRALTATLETFNPNNYWWSYEAQKNDGSGLLSGETAWNETGSDALPVQSGQGLDVSANNPVQVPGFSKGYWNFRLFAYKNSARTQLAYWGEADAVRIDNTHHTASVTVSPVAGDSGYLKVGTITFNPASAISGPTDLVVFEDTVSLKVGDGWKAIKWDEVPPYYMDGETKQTLPAAGYAYNSTTDTYTLPSGQYLFTRTYSYEGISVASGSVLATVYSNLTTTVSGSISELTSYAQFEAIQNPDAVNVSAEATGIKYDDSTKTSGYDLTDSENKVTAKISKTSVDKIMESIQVNAGTESGMDISDTTNTSMALSLGVDTTAQTATSVVYEISMTATITYTKNPGTSEAETKQTTADVSNVDDYVTAVIKMQKGLESVVVKHDGNDMTSASQWAAKDSVPYELTLENFLAYAGTESDADPYGYYYYVDGDNDATLYIKTKSFSPFTVSYKVPPKSVALTGGKLYSTLEGSTGAIANATDGATITLLADVELTEQIIVSKALTIDTNGNALTGYSNIVGRYDVEGSGYDYTKDYSGMDSETCKGVLAITHCEARINNTYYPTLVDALASALDKDTVDILKTITIKQNTASSRIPISKSITINGNGNTININARGFGVGLNATNKIDVTFIDVSIINENKDGRCIDTRGNLNSLKLDRVVLKTPAKGTQPLTIGGNQADIVPITIENSTIETTEEGKWGYAITTYNPVKMVIKDSMIKGWACLNIKGADSSAGSSGSTFTISGSMLVSKNVYSGETNAYSLVKIETDDIKVGFTLTGCDISIIGTENYQGIVSFQDMDFESVPNSVLSIGAGNVVTFEGLTYFADSTDNGSSLIITGGTFNRDPSNYVDKSCAVRMNGSLYEVYRPTYTDDFGVVYAKSDITSEVWDVLYDGSGLTVSEYTIPEGVKYIDDWAFYYCDTLQSISFPSTMREIGTNAFESATKLKNVYLNEGLLRIGERAFKKCSSLKTLGNETIGIPSTVVYIGNSAFQSCSSWTDSIVIPEGVNMAAEPEREGYNIPGWFCGCSSITSITIPENAEIIAKDMFRQTGITSITIPAKVREIGEYVFRDCENLTSIIVNIDGTKDLSISKNAFANMASPYPTTTMDIYNHDVYTYVTTLGLSSASYITFVDKNPQTTTQVESN